MIKFLSHGDVCKPKTNNYELVTDPALGVIELKRNKAKLLCKSKHSIIFVNYSEKLPTRDQDKEKE